MIALRPMKIEDYNFISNSYLKSYRNAPGVSILDNPTYYSEFKRRLDYLLLTSECVVACHIDDPDQIFGYRIGSVPVLHYVYVKYPFRRFGVAKALLKEFDLGKEFTIITHQPKRWSELMKKYNLVFNSQLANPKE